jgi:hypothetical protein
MFQRLAFNLVLRQEVYGCNLLELIVSPCISFSFFLGENMLNLSLSSVRRLSMLLICHTGSLPEAFCNHLYKFTATLGPHAKYYIH